MQLDQFVHINVLFLILVFIIPKAIVGLGAEIFRSMQSLEFGAQILTTLLQGTILKISFQVVSEMHDFPLEYLHFMSQFVEFNHVFCN